MPCISEQRSSQWTSYQGRPLLLVGMDVWGVGSKGGHLSSQVRAHTHFGSLNQYLLLMCMRQPDSSWRLEALEHLFRADRLIAALFTALLLYFCGQ